MGETSSRETLKMGQTSSPETLVSYQKTTPGKNPKDFTQHYDRGGSLQSQVNVCLRNKVKLFLSLICHHTMKIYGGMAPLFLNLQH
jgi:hypothetical protein